MWSAQYCCHKFASLILLLCSGLSCEAASLIESTFVVSSFLRLWSVHSFVLEQKSVQRSFGVTQDTGPSLCELCVKKSVS